MDRIFVGFDQREAVAYHVCCQSIIERAKRPLCIAPLALNLLDGFDGQRDGTNAFIYSRFLVPMLCDFGGWALFIDGDMVLRADVGRLFDMRDESKAVMVVKHDYKTRNPRKYVGTALESDNVDYPFKNWSSVILWNCGHPSNRRLTTSIIAGMSGRELHRFSWLKDSEVGGLPAKWNWLVGEYGHNENACLVHYTLGIPGFDHYKDCDHAATWHAAKRSMLHIED